MAAGVLITILPSLSNSNIKLQIAYDNNSTSMWYRYSLSGTYKAWTVLAKLSDIPTLDDVVQSDAILSNNTDIDSIVTNSRYFINSVNTHANLPDDMTTGFIRTEYPIMTSTNIALQIAYSKDINSMYYRYKTSEGWGVWSKIPNEKDVPKAIDLLDNVTYTENKAINEDGSISTNNYFEYSESISVEKNQDYVFFAYGANSTTGTQVRIHGYDANDEWVGQLTFVPGYTAGQRYIAEFHTNDDIVSIRISIRNKAKGRALYNGSTKKPQGIYFQSNGLVIAPIEGMGEYDISSEITVYGKNILLGGASIVQGFGGTGYAMDGETIIDISDTPEGQAYSTGGLWKRNTSGYCWANLFKELCESEYNATVDNNACQGTDIGFWSRHADVLIPSGYDLFLYTHSSNDRNYAPSIVRNRIKSGLQTLRDRCKSLGTQMVVFSPPPASKANEDTKQTKTWQCNEFIKEACNDLGLQFFDIQDEVIKYYYEHGASSAGTYVDGLHPDDTMYYHMYFCYCWLLNVSPMGSYEQPPT
ncbi:MAG: SGNH/GDSL hydrolase family protein [Aeriscardovia sp.]|nr:SGNH/GDSL hydrolase family protein [Aeriscardovia sp.]